MRNEYVGHQVNEYMITFRDGFKVHLDKIREDRIVKSKDNIYIILSNATISDEYANKIFTAKSNLIDEILSQSEWREVDSGKDKLVCIDYKKCELLTFSISNKCDQFSEYKMFIKLNKNNMNITTK